jgi:hypothetical protein
MVVVGGACCAAPGQEVGAAFWSTDGMAWQATAPATLPTAPSSLAGYPYNDVAVSMLIAVGLETYALDPSAAWTMGEPLPGVEDVPFVASATLNEILVVGEGRSWMAPMYDVVTQEDVPPVQPQAIGSTFEFGLLTHCGPSVIQFDLRAWLPDPATLVGGEYPASFEDPAERGTLAYVAQDLLEFTGRQGDVVRFLPADEQPGPSFCA